MHGALSACARLRKRVNTECRYAFHCVGLGETIYTSTKSLGLLLKKHLETRHSVSALVGQCGPIAFEAIVDAATACWHLGAILKDIAAANLGHRLQFLHTIS